MRGRKRSANVVSFFAFQDIITAVTGVLVLVTLILALSVTLSTPTVVANSQEPIEAVESDEIERLREEIKQQLQRFEQLLELDRIALLNDPEQLRRQIDQARADLQRAQDDLAQARQSLENRRSELEIEQGELAAMAERLGMQDLEARAAELQDQLRQLEASNRVVFNFRDLRGKSAWLIDLAQDRIQVAQVAVAEPPRVFDAREIDQVIAWMETLDARNTHLVLFVRPGTLAAYERLSEAARLLGVSMGFEVLDETTQLIDPQRGASL